MTRHLYTFLGTFVVGALIALAARAAWFNPNGDHPGATAGGGDYAPMVANASPTAESHASHPPTATAASKTDHSGHGAPGDAQANAAPPHNDDREQSASAPASATSATVNSVCAICGMDVDPDLPTAEYQGKTIGFGCKACPAIFKANPDKYGPAYLRNEVVNR